MFNSSSTAPFIATQNLLPSIASAYNLGDAAKPFLSIYLTSQVIFNNSGAGAISSIKQAVNGDAVALCGGVSASVSNGAYVLAHSNAFSGAQGQLHLFGGNHASGHIITKLGNASALIKFQDPSADDFLGFSSTTATNLEMIFGSGSTAAQVLTIRGNRTDGNDDGRLVLCGGNGSGSGRGASITIAGNEYSGTGGAATLRGGDVSTGHVSLRAMNAAATVQIYTDDTLRWQWNAAGSLLPSSTHNIGSSSQDAGSIYARFIGTGGANSLGLFTNNTTRWSVGDTGDFIGAPTSGIIRKTASTGYMYLTAGNAVAAAQGGFIELAGISAADTGRMRLQGGTAAGAHIILRLNHANALIQFQNSSANSLWSVTNAGNLNQDATDGGLLVFNKANTTIDFAGAMGTSAKDPSAVAEDGWIEIKVAGVTKYVPYYNAS